MNGVATITISGQVVRLKFGLPAVRRVFEKMAEHTLVEKRGEEERYNDLGIAHVLYAGYLNGCMLHDAAPTLSFEHFYDYIEDFADDQSGKEEIIAAIRAFEESRFVKRMETKPVEEGEHLEKKSHSNGMR